MVMEDLLHILVSPLRLKRMHSKLRKLNKKSVSKTDFTEIWISTAFQRFSRGSTALNIFALQIASSKVL